MKQDPDDKNLVIAFTFDRVSSRIWFEGIN